MSPISTLASRTFALNVILKEFLPIYYQNTNNFLETYSSDPLAAVPKVTMYDSVQVNFILLSFAK